MKSVNLTYIYCLKDPRNNCIRYIGKSDCPNERYANHISEAKNNRKSNYKINWIKSLLKLNLKPKLEILNIVEKQDWQIFEIELITKMREEIKTLNLPRLTNYSDGGDGFYDPTGKIAKKISKSLKKSVKFQNLMHSDFWVDKMKKRIMPDSWHNNFIFTKDNVNKKFKKNIAKDLNNLKECIYCGIKSNKLIIGRWHNKNCKMNPEFNQERRRLTDKQKQNISEALLKRSVYKKKKSIQKRSFSIKQKWEKFPNQFQKGVLNAK